MFGLGRGIIEATGGGGAGTGDSGAAPPAYSPTYSAPSTYTAPAYSAPVAAFTSNGQIVSVAPAGAGVAQAGVFGDGVYTPLDYPAMRFLGADQKLSEQGAEGREQSVAAPSIVPLLLLAGAIYLLAK